MKAAATTTEADFRKLLNLPERSIDRTERELGGKPHLTGDRRAVEKEIKLRAVDARQAKTAAEAMGGRLPDPDEGMHLAISGRFALWDFVPAVLGIAGARIDTLTIATLGFSRRNIGKMCELVDAEQIGQVRLLASHYFAGTSKAIYDYAVAEFTKRPNMEFASLRTHAKILLVALADGRRVTIESSANLRSCKNIEQASLFGSPTLYEFHHGWIASLFERASK